MKLTVPRMVLLTALQRVIPAVGGKSTLPFLNGIHFTVEKNMLYLTGSNLDFTVQTMIDLSQLSEEGFSFSEGQALPLAKITDILRRLPESSVDIRINPENNQCIARSGSSRFVINGFNPEEYPKFNEPDAEWPSFSLPAAKLKKILRLLLFAVGREIDRPAFTGVNFILENGCLTVQSSDTFRLAQQKTPVEYEGEGRSFLVMGKYLFEVEKLLEKEKDVNIYLGEKSVFFRSENIAIEARLMQEKYTSFDSIFPSQSTTRVKVDREAFYASVERAALLSEGINHSAEFHISSGSILVRSRSEIGETEEQIDAKITGEELKVVLNCRFLMDVLKVLEGEEAEINFNGSFGPCLITSPEEEGYVYLTLPLKTS